MACPGCSLSYIGQSLRLVLWWGLASQQYRASKLRTIWSQGTAELYAQLQSRTEAQLARFEEFALQVALRIPPGLILNQVRAIQAVRD